jgi:hypothetical protein
VIAFWGIFLKYSWKKSSRKSFKTFLKFYYFVKVYDLKNSKKCHFQSFSSPFTCLFIALKQWL